MKKEVKNLLLGILIMFVGLVTWNISKFTNSITLNNIGSAITGIGFLISFSYGCYILIDVFEMEENDNIISLNEPNHCRCSTADTCSAKTDVVNIHLPESRPGMIYHVENKTPGRQIIIHGHPDQYTFINPGDETKKSEL